MGMPTLNVSISVNYAIKENPKTVKALKGIGIAVAVIAAAGLLAAGVAGSMALVGGHASWAPHFMSAMNTMISSKGAWIPYAMTSLGGPGAFIATILAGLAVYKGGKGLKSCVTGFIEKREAASAARALATSQEGERQELLDKIGTLDPARKAALAKKVLKVDAPAFDNWEGLHLSPYKTLIDAAVQEQKDQT